MGGAGGRASELQTGFRVTKSGERAEFRGYVYDTEETAAVSHPSVRILLGPVRCSFEANSPVQHSHPVLRRTEKLFHPGTG